MGAHRAAIRNKSWEVNDIMVGVRVDIIIGKLEWGFSEIEVATMVVMGEELLVQEESHDKREMKVGSIMWETRAGA